jgi:VanZ family protein
MVVEKYRVYRILFWIALFGSYVLAVLPQEEVPRLTPFNDKGNHFIAFAVLTTLLLYAYRIRYLSSFGWMLSYGIFIEISQLFTINRNSELLDVVADSIGALIGILLYRLIRKFYPE